ncbi:MAG: hypothetical protein AB1782_12950 [Cyanobacteriota bacterium]
MIYKKLIASLMLLGLIIGTPAITYAHDNVNCKNNTNQQCQEKKKGSKVTKALKYAAFGAGAGYVLSGEKNRGTNMVKGAAIGTAASFLLDK